MRSKEEIQRAYEKIKDFGFGSSYPPGVEPSENTFVIGQTLKWVLSYEPKFKTHPDCKYREWAVLDEGLETMHTEYNCIYKRKNIPCPYREEYCWQCADYTESED